MTPRTVWIEAIVLEQQEQVLSVSLKDGFGNARAVVDEKMTRAEAPR